MVCHGLLALRGLVVADAEHSYNRWLTGSQPLSEAGDVTGALTAAVTLTGEDMKAHTQKCAGRLTMTQRNAKRWRCQPLHHWTKYTTCFTGHWINWISRDNYLTKALDRPTYRNTLFIPLSTYLGLFCSTQLIHLCEAHREFIMQPPTSNYMKWHYSHRSSVPSFPDTEWVPTFTMQVMGYTVRLFALVIFIVLYMCLGALLFSYLEAPREEEWRLELNALRLNFLLNNTCVSGEIKTWVDAHLLTAVFMVLRLGFWEHWIKACWGKTTSSITDLFYSKQLGHCWLSLYCSGVLVYCPRVDRFSPLVHYHDRYVGNHNYGGGYIQQRVRFSDKVIFAWHVISITKCWK